MQNSDIFQKHCKYFRMVCFLSHGSIFLSFFCFLPPSVFFLSSILRLHHYFSPAFLSSVWYLLYDHEHGVYLILSIHEGKRNKRFFLCQGGPIKQLPSLALGGALGLRLCVALIAGAVIGGSWGYSLGLGVWG